jgi:hypothetical protein
MSFNIDKAIGDALIRQARLSGFEVYVRKGETQVAIRPIDPSRGAQLPQNLAAEINNKRHSILVALAGKNVDAIEREAAVAAAEARLKADRERAALERQPGFGSHPPLSDAGDPEADTDRNNLPPEPTVDPLTGEVAQ